MTHSLLEVNHPSAVGRAWACGGITQEGEDSWYPDAARPGGCVTRLSQRRAARSSGTLTLRNFGRRDALPRDGRIRVANFNV